MNWLAIMLECVVSLDRASIVPRKKRSGKHWSENVASETANRVRTCYDEESCDVLASEAVLPIPAHSTKLHQDGSAKEHRHVSSCLVFNDYQSNK